LKEVTKAAKNVEPVPQDSNNNSTDDKSVMTSPSIRQNVSASAQPKEKEDKPATDISRKVSAVEGPIDYDDGQWSPANLAGKKYYTRDQLLKLKDLPIAAVPTKLPENVASSLMKFNKEFLTSTLNQTMPVTGGMQRASFDPVNSLTPKFMAPAMSGRNPYPNKRPSQQGNKQQMPGNGRGSQAGIIKLTLSLQDDVKLNEAENAWKPSHLVKKAELTEEERVTYDLLSRFRSMLNKLTAENFGLLVEEVKTYKIDSSERLDGVISLLFEKAISEPKFAPTYANLCKEVAFITTAPQGEASLGKKNTLKGKLITQCQKEFERHREESIVFNEIEAKLRELENQPEHADEKARLEEEHYRVRQRANGTVKFIGELYKIEMLTSNIMRACILMLLQEPTEEKIERVCKLLTTIGGKLEEKDGRSSLDSYFSQLSEMLHPAHKIIKSSRIKFEIQNLEDLRNNHWVTRRQDLTPRTMDQIQMEADREQQMINYQTRQNAKEDRNRGGNQGGFNRRQQQQDNDGWQTQQNKSRLPALQFNKISLPTMNSEGPKLGAPTDFQKFMVNSSNKFSGLPVDTDVDNQPSRFGGPGGGSKNSSMERGSDRGGHYYGNNGSMGNDGRYSGRSSGSNQGSRNSSQIRSRDNSDGRGGPSRSLQAPPRHNQIPSSGGSSLSFSGAVKQPQKAATPTMPAEPMTQKEIDKNYKEMLTIVNEFRDDKLTLEKAMAALQPLSINKDVLVEIYNKFLDRKDIDRENLMMVVCELLKTKKITREINRAALIDTMKLAPDMLCDVPRVYEYIGQFYGKIFRIWPLNILI
jgi:translation initiation factor 4G